MATKMAKGLEHFSRQERLRELRAGMFSLEKRCRRGSCQCVQIPDGRKQRIWSGVFTVLLSDKTRGSTHKPKYKNFFLNTRKNTFTARVVKRLNRSPRETVQSLSLEVFKAHLDTARSSLSLLAPLRAGDQG